jgi:hypothetical protein
MSENLPKEYLEQAETHCKSAKTLFEHWESPESIQMSQRCVELCLKAVLKQYGIEPPHKHDVGAELAQISAKLPESFQAKIAKFRLASLTLAVWRDPVTYGLEQMGPSKMFSKEEADLALHFAEEVYSSCSPIRYGAEPY